MSMICIALQGLAALILMAVGVKLAAVNADPHAGIAMWICAAVVALCAYAQHRYAEA